MNFLIILYQLTKFEAPSCYPFPDIMITNFKSPNLQREIIRKLYNNFFFYKFSPFDIFIIIYQQTKFDAPSCSTFRDIMITKFQSPNLQMEIIRNQKNIITFL